MMPAGIPIRPKFRFAAPSCKDDLCASGTTKPSTFSCGVVSKLDVLSDMKVRSTQVANVGLIESVVVPRIAGAG